MIKPTRRHCLTEFFFCIISCIRKPYQHAHGQKWLLRPKHMFQISRTCQRRTSHFPCFYNPCIPVSFSFFRKMLRISHSRYGPYILEVLHAKSYGCEERGWVKWTLCSRAECIVRMHVQTWNSVGLGTWHQALKWLETTGYYPFENTINVK
jgi:hypothetical protein